MIPGEAFASPGIVVFDRMKKLCKRCPLLQDVDTKGDKNNEKEIMKKFFNCYCGIKNIS